MLKLKEVRVVVYDNPSPDGNDGTSVGLSVAGNVVRADESRRLLPKCISVDSRLQRKRRTIKVYRDQDLNRVPPGAVGSTGAPNWSEDLPLSELGDLDFQEFPRFIRA